MHSYSEKVQQLITALYEFAATCERPNGTRYGTAGQCRKGREVSRQELSETLYTPAMDELKAYRVYAKRSGELDKGVAQDAYTVLGGRETLSSELLNKAHKMVETEFVGIKQRMENGTISADEIKEYATTHFQVGDLKTARVVTIGMEYGANKLDISDHIATMMAQEKVSKALGASYIPKEVRVVGAIQSGAVTKFLDKGQITGIVNNYVREQTLFAAGLDHKYVKPWELELGMGTASLEARAIPSPKSGQWPYKGLDWVKNSKEIQAVIGSRKNAEAFDNRRFQEVSNRVKNAVKENKNPDLSIMLSPGKGVSEAISNKVINDLAKEGYPVKSFKYTWSEQFNDYRTGRMVHLGENRYVYDLGGSISAQPSPSGGLKAFQKAKLEFQQEISAGTVAQYRSVSSPSPEPKTKKPTAKTSPEQPSSPQKKSVTQELSPQQKEAMVGLLRERRKNAVKDRDSRMIQIFDAEIAKLM